MPASQSRRNVPASSLLLNLLLKGTKILLCKKDSVDVEENLLVFNSISSLVMFGAWLGRHYVMVVYDNTSTMRHIRQACCCGHIVLIELSAYNQLHTNTRSSRIVARANDLTPLYPTTKGKSTSSSAAHHNLIRPVRTFRWCMKTSSSNRTDV